jgi:uncharacterized protein (TIGR00255 family)
MTGFARAADSDATWRWTWEARSVNGRGLDLRVRVPSGLDRIEFAARNAAGGRFQRGSLSLNLAVEPVSGPADMRIDRDRLKAYAAIAAELQAVHGLAPARADGLLALRGVIDGSERGLDSFLDAAAGYEPRVLATLTQALEGLGRARAAEGDRLAAVLSTLLDAVETLIGAARGRAASQPATLRARLETQLAEIAAAVPPLSAERLAQEVALLATKADVAEELARLEAHVAQARGLLAEGAAVGRKLEFLAQEFNREANTLCSKSADLELTRIGLDLKTQIDRLREQAANVE